jgi:methylated-DNA-[protein]-cysteine S-methyltransferase
VGWPCGRSPRPRAIDGIVALLGGEPADLTAVPLDMERLPAFQRAVYEIARTIPPGDTLTYGEIAARLGDPGTARAVGQALGSNPFPIVVPCHRVLAAGGRLGGFSAHGGTATKLRLLTLERARAVTPSLFDGV